MDPITIIGILLALGATFAALFMGGMDPVAIFFGSPASIVLVLVGTIGVTLASGTMAQATGAAKVMIKAITGGGSADQAATIKQLVEFAEVARKEGLLALESRVESIEDPFLKMGLELAVDGTDPDEIADIMALDLRRLMMRHKDGAAFFTNAAGFAPAMGMVGTVLGLIDMLGKLDDPSTLGPSMAVAFITTLWGAFLANFLFMPIANRLKKLSADEVTYRELVIEGVLAVQSGANPRALAGKLVAFLPPGKRGEVLEQRGA